MIRWLICSALCCTGVSAADIKGQAQPIDNPFPAPIMKGEVVIELETVATDLVSPLGMRWPDDGTGRMFIYDQTGVVYVVESSGDRSMFLDVRARLVDLMEGFDERGLLGFELHPGFAENGLVYTYTSEPATGMADFQLDTGGAALDHHNVVAEWRVDAKNSNAIDPASRRELFRMDHPQFNHNAGDIWFGPDGFLYIVVGDGGAADDQGPGHGANGNGQNPNTPHGSILRIDPDPAGSAVMSANGEYSIPANNPFVGTDMLDEIFAYGFRNPFRFSFDSVTFDLWLADVGQNDIEEVNVVSPGGNFGWRIKEGSFFFNTNGEGAGFVTDAPENPPAPPDLIDPVAEYDHDEGLAVIGGFVYRGMDIPALEGMYVFGDNGMDPAVKGRLFYLDATDTIVEFQIGMNDRVFGRWLKGFAQGPDGELYALSSGNLGPMGRTGVVQKIVPLGPPQGCRISSAPGNPANGLRGDLAIVMSLALTLVASGVSRRRRRKAIIGSE